MKLLVIVEGYDPQMPLAAFLKKINAGQIYLIYLSPRVKAEEYKQRLESAVDKSTRVEIVNYRDTLNYESLRQGLFDFIASLPGQLKVGRRRVSEYLIVQGLNMWWSSGVIEATAYKRELMKNLYYLSGVRDTLEKFGIDAVWSCVSSASLSRDLATMLKLSGIRHFRPHDKGILSAVKYYLIRFKSWLIFLMAHAVSAVLFRVICPKSVKPAGPDADKKDIHLFYSYYPYSLRLSSNPPRAKIYEDLPLFLARKLGGEDYYLCFLSSTSLFNLGQLVRDARNMWRAGFRFLPADMFVSFWEGLCIFFSPARYWKYFRLKRSPGYRRAFIVNGINLYHTFDSTFRNSLAGNDAWITLIHYYAFRNFVRKYVKRISQVVYHIEFHNWEAALINAVKDACESLPIIGLQQSAPNPILLSPFMMEGIFTKDYDYPLADLILCSGKLYKEMLVSAGVNPERIEVVGHIHARYLQELPLSLEEKLKRRKKFNLRDNKKICVLACSIDITLTEGLVCMLKDIVRRFPHIDFLFQEHPHTPVEPLLRKYNLFGLANVKSLPCPIPEILPLADYFLSNSTSVAVEALYAGIPQANLDVVGLPKANPLHNIPGLIKDVGSENDLWDFFLSPESFSAPRERSFIFIDPNKDPYQRCTDIILERFHNTTKAG